MIKQGRLDKPYKGIVDCFKRTMQAEGEFVKGIEGAKACILSMSSCFLIRVLTVARFFLRLPSLAYRHCLALAW